MLSCEVVLELLGRKSCGVHKDEGLSDTKAPLDQPELEPSPCILLWMVSFRSTHPRRRVHHPNLPQMLQSWCPQELESSGCPHRAHPWQALL